MTAMGRLAATFGVLLTVSGPQTAFGQNSTYYQEGNELHDDCGRGGLLVMGYVEGIIDGRLYMNDGFCVPLSVQARQLKDVVCSALSGNPKDRHSTGASLVVSALREAWPCT